VKSGDGGTKFLNRKYYAQIRLGLRITVAGLLGFVLCPLFGLSITAEPLPEWIRAELVSPGEIAGSALSRFLAGCGNAISQRQSAPSYEECEQNLLNLNSGSQMRDGPIGRANFQMKMSTGFPVSHSASSN